MAERKSKPRKMEPVEEEEQTYNWWQLAMYLVAAVAVIEVMGMVSMFLSGGGNNIPVWLYYLFGGTVVVAGLFWLASWFSTRGK